LKPGKNINVRNGLVPSVVLLFGCTLMNVRVVIKNGFLLNFDLTNCYYQIRNVINSKNFFCFVLSIMTNNSIHIAIIAEAAIIRRLNGGDME
jgi:hypothetical protein